MISSAFVREILFLLIDGFDEEMNLRKQIDLLIDGSILYTGVGFKINFEHTSDANQYGISTNDILNGVNIESSDLQLGAQASLFFDNGIISYLEILSNSGYYPDEPLKDYCLSQAWLPGGGRKVIFP